MPIIGGITFDSSIYLNYYGQLNEDNYFTSFGKTDYYYGGNKSDNFVGDGNSDTMFGGDGVDLLNGSGGDDLLYGEAGLDILIGGIGNDLLFGGSGSDDLIGGAGADQLFGGSGMDFAMYYNSPASVLVNLATSTASGGHATGDTLYSIESVIGSQFNDILTGSDGENTLFGFGGNDTINGGAGNDVIAGGANGTGIAGDRMWGGAGADVFQFEPGESGGGNAKDIIYDFDTAEDTLRFLTFGPSIELLENATGFSGMGNQAYYEQYFDNNLSLFVTEVHVRIDDFEIGEANGRYDVILLGSHTLDSSHITSF